MTDTIVAECPPLRIDHPAAWTGSQMQAHPEIWLETLDPAETAELQAAA